MKNLNPGELKLRLLCEGMEVDASCDVLTDGRSIRRTRAGLGSGVELLLPDDLYVNVPVFEPFTRESPFTLVKEGNDYYIREKPDFSVKVELTPKPRFYDMNCSSGTPMHRVGVMQGTTLGIYPSRVCEFWEMEPRMNCKFCSTGLNVGVSEETEKSIEDVVELCIAAKKHDRITFVHFNTGYYSEDALDVVRPYVEAVKKATGLLIGVQCPPSRDLKKYDELKRIGVDHFSFCYELHNPECFSEVCPGKAKYLGQKPFFDAIEYTSKLMGKGRVSGEIIAGLEPLEDTFRAIEYITGVGAFPTVCIFRPLLKTDYENHPWPETEDMRKVFQRLYRELKRNSIMTGIAPRVKTSLVILPYESRYFRSGTNLSDILYDMRIFAARLVFRSYFKLKLMAG